MFFSILEMVRFISDENDTLGLIFLLLHVYKPQYLELVKKNIHRNTFLYFFRAQKHDVMHLNKIVVIPIGEYLHRLPCKRGSPCFKFA